MLKRWKAKINFWFEDIVTPMGRTVDIIVVSLVFLVSLILVIKTYPISEDLRGFLDRTEYVIVGIFVVEYLLRLWSSPSRLRHIFKLYSLIDLVAILPIFFPDEHYEVLRIFRALRFLRLIRFLNREHFFFRKLKPTHIYVIRILYIIVAIIFCSAGMIFYAEHDLPDTNIHTFFDAIYFSIVTLTTVGFGDITPVSSYGRFITILMIASGIVFIPWQIRHLVHEISSPSGKIEVSCSTCDLRYHDNDAIYCKKCGSALEKKRA